MSVNELVANFSVLMPFNIVVIWASALLLLDVFLLHKRKGLTALLAALGLVVALGFALTQIGEEVVAFGGMVVVDGFATFLTILLLASGLIAIALAYDYLRRMNIDRGEYYVLLLFSLSGMMLMAVAADLIVVFLALELLSIPLYVLAGFARPQTESEEAALKYFLMGAFAGGFILFGIALVYGATGQTGLAEIVKVIDLGAADTSLMVAGAALILVGLGFKVAAVPFHMWTPDVYEGSPSTVTAFMALGAKAAGFAALLRIFVTAFPSLVEDITPIFWVLAALTMILGNFVAIAQRNIKRMLAYSSIAHAGYILMALVPYAQENVNEDSVAAALFYLLAYALTNFGAWAVVIALEKREGKGLKLEDYAGLGRKYPVLAATMTVFMLSFIGIPPTLGFVGKFYLFRTVLDGGFPGLALIGLLTSLVSAYYYLRVVVYMYMREGEPEVRRESWLYLTAVVTAVCVVLLSIFSEPLLNAASQAALLLY
jgi:NADH-quinone oxidoreductase subunit N